MLSEILDSYLFAFSNLESYKFLAKQTFCFFVIVGFLK